MDTISLVFIVLALLVNVGFAVFVVSRLRSHRFIERLSPKLDNSLMPGINSPQLIKYRKRGIFWMIVVFSICGFNLALLAVYGIVIVLISN